MVETRTAKAREQTQVLTATTAPITNTLPGELKALQDEDQMLESYKTEAVEGTTKHTKDGEVSFVRRKGVLYLQAENGEQKFKQLLVPKTKREEELAGWSFRHRQNHGKMVKSFLLAGSARGRKKFLPLMRQMPEDVTADQPPTRSTWR